MSLMNGQWVEEVRADRLQAGMAKHGQSVEGAKTPAADKTCADPLCLTPLIVASETVGAWPSRLPIGPLLWPAARGRG
jgi:hypothetical protein